MTQQTVLSREYGDEYLDDMYPLGMEVLPTPINLFPREVESVEVHRKISPPWLKFQQGKIGKNKRNKRG